MQTTPTSRQIRAAILAATRACESCRAIRKTHRGHRRPHRGADIDDALDRLVAPARRIRRYSGMVFTHEISEQDAAALRAATKEIVYERRQLRKMR